MKNILFINYGENWIRGQELCLISLLKNIDKAKYNPIAICNADQLKNELSKSGINTYLTDIPQISYEGKYSKYEILSYIKALFFFRSVIKKHRIDLIYSNSGLPSQLGYPMARLFSIPLITHIHAPYTKRYAWMWFFKFADRVIFVSDTTRKFMEKKVRFKKTEMIYNGVDIERFKPVSVKNVFFRKSHGINDDDIVIGQTGSLINRKGVDLLLEAFASLTKNYNNLILVIVGDGSEKNELIELSHKLGVSDRIRFVGDVKNSEMFYSHLFDINVLASREEAFPLTLLEGAACALPNVGSNVGGIPEIIDDGINGYLFEKESVPQLIEKLAFLINDQTLRKNMGESGREKMEKNFSLEKYSNNISNVIDKCLPV
ncbi:MAG: glycosyltransferase [Geobacter sp.]|nr:glycosyltransferase [Geobacter sp.]